MIVDRLMTYAAANEVLGFYTEAKAMREAARELVRRGAAIVRLEARVKELEDKLDEETLSYKADMARFG